MSERPAWVSIANGEQRAHNAALSPERLLEIAAILDDAGLGWRASLSAHQLRACAEAWRAQVHRHSYVPGQPGCADPEHCPTTLRRERDEAREMLARAMALAMPVDER
jgi:hypothetical protein